MIWDYRIVENNGMFTIHEVHYNDKEEIISVSEDPMGPSGETLEDLKDDIQYFLQALDSPVLKKDEIVLAPTRDRKNS
jgi:CCR4-NOT transcriptional regulation complex NOT5 subunit